jgi:hypothetical protein
MTKLEELKAVYWAAWDAACDAARAADDAWYAGDVTWYAYVAARNGAEATMDAAWDAYKAELKKQEEITMYAPELNMDISGWYEAEDGVGFVEIGEAFDVKDLANKLLDKYGGDILGVDMELDGEYADGSAVNDMAVMVELERIGG